MLPSWRAVLARSKIVVGPGDGNGSRVAKEARDPGATGNGESSPDCLAAGSATRTTATARGSGALGPTSALGTASATSAGAAAATDVCSTWPAGAGSFGARDEASALGAAPGVTRTTSAINRWRTALDTTLPVSVLAAAKPAKSPSDAAASSDMRQRRIS